MTLTLTVEPTIAWNHLLGPHLFLSLLSVSSVLDLIPWRIWVQSSITATPLRMTQVASKVYVNQINPTLGDLGIHLWEAIPGPPFPDTGSSVWRLDVKALRTGPLLCPGG